MAGLQDFLRKIRITADPNDGNAIRRLHLAALVDGRRISPELERQLIADSLLKQMNNGLLQPNNNQSNRGRGTGIPTRVNNEALTRSLGGAMGRSMGNAAGGGLSAALGGTANSLGGVTGLLGRQMNNDLNRVPSTITTSNNALNSYTGTTAGGGLSSVLGGTSPANNPSRNVPKGLMNILASSAVADPAKQALYDQYMAPPVSDVPDSELGLFLKDPNAYANFKTLGKVDSSILSNYKYAKLQGYPGTFAEYQQEIAAAGAPDINLPGKSDQEILLENLPRLNPGESYVYTRNPETNELEFKLDERGLPIVTTLEGSKADNDRIYAENAAENKETNDLMYKSVVFREIDRAIDFVENPKILPTTGLLGGQIFKHFGNTVANNLDKSLGAIKSFISFDKLQRIREASPTGGALGQVSNFELALLEKSMGSLEQSTQPGYQAENLRYLKLLLNQDDLAGRIHAMLEGIPYVPPPEGQNQNQDLTPFYIKPDDIDSDLWNVMTDSEKRLLVSMPKNPDYDRIINTSLINDSTSESLDQEQVTPTSELSAPKQIQPIAKPDDIDQALWDVLTPEEQAQYIQGN